ncbi:hypothetical protein B1K97_00455 [Bacillus toyonensis]|nr:hypothetical protein B1K97_00455 [Bacillus toyonensis]
MDIIYSAHKSYCLNEIQKYDTIIIVSHGGPDAIYHKYDFKNSRHQILLNKDNLGILKDRKIIAISCATARELGREACKSGGCKAFLGFYNKIHFDKLNKEIASRKYRFFVWECYKDTFAQVIEEAIKNNWTFGKLKEVLNIELRRAVTARALEIKRKKPKFYKSHGLDQAILAVTDVSNNINVFGDEQEKVN